MLQSVDYLDEILEAQHRHEQEMVLTYYASEVLEALDYQMNEGAEAISRAMRACAALHVSVELHFKRTYCWQEDQMQADWLLTPLASYFLIVNSDPSHPAVARAQLLLLKQRYSL